jgi:AraC-like DNA-binding protein
MRVVCPARRDIQSAVALSRAHRILSDPRFADRNISSVAFDVGFGDLSYFNRTFRRSYAATPTDIKQSSMSTDPPRR